MDYEQTELLDAGAGAPICALFPSTSQARDALLALEEAGVPASAISVVEAQPGAGVVFGPATTLTPGGGPYGWSGPYTNLYPAAVGGSFNPAIVEVPDRDSLAMTLTDQGLPEAAAGECAEAILIGEVFATIAPEPPCPDRTEVERIITLNGGRLPSS